MFTEIKGQFIDSLEEQKWMDNATRDQARLKVGNIDIENTIVMWRYTKHPIPKWT